ncbi:uncharacterized protein LOC134188604 [Corticium candelabrum]|uniref:uncharacterized protein LOC134188604 n=1 Tax=Corticium candelabrum TaxID=121492 RepID=UPI002E26BDC1|nr:uncharacterized protein LOC134188604 [Corticium candelabrum]
MADVGNYDLVWRVVAGNREIVQRKAEKVDDEDVRNPQTSDVGRRLDLSMLSIDENWLSESLQQESLKYYSITVLNLNDCGLKSIPNFICNVTNVIRLRIHSNHLKTLPDTIGDLQYLERLSAYGNQLESLPQSLYKLRQLKILRLGGNKLHNKDLHRIQEMIGLQQLYLRQNPYITSIPHKLYHMDNLTELNADDCGNRALSPVPRPRSTAVQRTSKLPEPSRYEETRSSELTDETKPFAKAFVDDGADKQSQGILDKLPKEKENPMIREFIDRNPLKQLDAMLVDIPVEDVYWCGGILSMMTISREPAGTDVVSFSAVIGQSGGKCGSDDIFLIVPSGAVLLPQVFQCDIMLHSHCMPPTDSDKEEMVVSPCVRLSPSEVNFRDYVQLQLPAFVSFKSTHSGSGWLLRLMMIYQTPDIEPAKWHTALTINTATGEVVSQSPSVQFDSHRGIIYLRHFCCLCWLGSILNIQSWVEKCVSYVLFGKRLEQHKWMVSVHVIHGANVVVTELRQMLEMQSYILLRPAINSIIGRCGYLTLSAKANDPWKLCKQSAEARISTKLIWNGPINGATNFEVIMEDPTGNSGYLECTFTAAFEGDYMTVEPVTLDVTFPISSDFQLRNSSTTAHQPNIFKFFISNSQNLAFGSNPQIGIAPSSVCTVDRQVVAGALPVTTDNTQPLEGVGESISAITGITISPDHIPIGVSKLLHIALNSPVAQESAMSSGKCIVQFISQGQDESKIEETGAESVNNEVEVLFPAWPLADHVLVRIALATDKKQQLGVGFVTVGEFL